MKSPNGTIVVQVKEMIHDIVLKAFDSVVTLNDIFMTSPNCITELEAWDFFRWKKFMFHHMEA